MSSSVVMPMVVFAMPPASSSMFCGRLKYCRMRAAWARSAGHLWSSTVCADTAPHTGMASDGVMLRCSRPMLSAARFAPARRRAPPSSASTVSPYRSPAADARAAMHLASRDVGRSSASRVRSASAQRPVARSSTAVTAASSSNVLGGRVSGGSSTAASFVAFISVATFVSLASLLPDAFFFFCGLEAAGRGSSGSSALFSSRPRAPSRRFASARSRASLSSGSSARPDPLPGCIRPPQSPLASFFSQCGCSLETESVLLLPSTSSSRRPALSPGWPGTPASATLRPPSHMRSDSSAYDTDRHGSPGHCAHRPPTSRKASRLTTTGPDSSASTNATPPVTPLPLPLSPARTVTPSRQPAPKPSMPTRSWRPSSAFAAASSSGVTSASCPGSTSTTALALAIATSRLSASSAVIGFVA
mmetsp:Transcript_4946/g.12476  ORF Transcript_4946/g.12476 Transcript_4946/m.12476 type:complete len:417 (+) Transcript_4946:247-1497(+)